MTEATSAQKSWDRVFDLVMDLICVAGTDGFFKRVNPAFTRTLGFTEEELLASPFFDFIHPEDVSATLAEVQKLAAGQDTIDFENRYLRKDGSYCWIAWRCPAPAPGSGLLYGVGRDVTEHKRVEMEFRKAMAATEAASRAKSEFVANMSHEVRTPLNGILGMTELALEAEVTPRVRDYLETINQSAELLLMIVNDILDFSKMESGKFQLDSTEFPLRETLEITLQALASRAHKKGLELAFHIDPATPDALIGDPVRLRQVITNLVGNAVKFTDQGEVVVHVEPERNGELASDTLFDSGLVRLHGVVRDTGIGIPPDKQERIFEAFSQADMSTTRKYGGTGLGLTISSYLIQQMGGRIWVESREGEGSEFHFTAAFRAQESSNVVAAPAPELTLAGLPVLVVDDNRTNRRILEEMLSGWGLFVTLAEDGPAALAAIAKAQQAGQPFRVAALDFHMPGMDGYELARRIKALDEATRPAVIVLTSSDRPGDCSRFEQLGVQGYLTKPVRQSKLREAIVQALSAERANTPVAAPSPVAKVRPLRVLVAEDSPVNQKLVLELLTRQGHHVELATNGHEALRSLESQRFDLVLMDVQMPELDGFEATRRIRSRETERGDHTPIVAMTAHAMTGDRQRCLAAGMDDYLSKPIRSRELYAKIAEVMERQTATPAGDSTIASADDPTGPAVHWEQAIEEMAGDEALLLDLAQTLVDDAPRLLLNIRRAVESKDPEEMRLAAHTIKGSVRPFAALRASEFAFRLENLARRGELASAPNVLEELERELALVLDVLRARLNGRPSSESPLRQAADR